MSDNIDFHVLDYRSLVVSFGRELTSEEVYEVAYMWLSKKGDVSKYKQDQDLRTGTNGYTRVLSNLLPRKYRRSTRNREEDKQVRSGGEG